MSRRAASTRQRCGQRDEDAFRTRPLDCKSPVGTLAGERRELVARERDFFLEPNDPPARGRNRSLDLLELHSGVEPRGDALAGEIVDRPALLERSPREVELVESARKLHVDTGDSR